MTNEIKRPVLKIGDRIRLLSGLAKGSEGVIVSTLQLSYSGHFLPLMKFTKRTPEVCAYGYGNNGNGYSSQGCADYWFISDSVEVEIIVHEPPKKRGRKPRKFSPNTQNGKLLAYLLEGKTITRIIADHMFRIASLTRRIRDLRDAGHDIKAEVKVDPHGNNYTEYSMAVKPQRKYR